MLDPEFFNNIGRTAVIPELNAIGQLWVDTCHGWCARECLLWHSDCPKPPLCFREGLLFRGCPLRTGLRLVRDKLLPLAMRSSSACSSAFRNVLASRNR
jgi:hypothetical protein